MQLDMIPDEVVTTGPFFAKAKGSAIASSFTFPAPLRSYDGLCCNGKYRRGNRGEISGEGEPVLEGIQLW